MASMNNVPREILESMRECLDRRLKLSIKRLVNYETKKEKIEQRVLAFSTYRLFILTAKIPTKIDANFHYLDIKSIESKRPNQLVICASNKTYSFLTMEADTDEVNHMITHIGTSLKTVFPKFSLERLIKTVEVQPSDRLKVMNDLCQTIGQKGMTPCGNFTVQYMCMCDFHGLTYRDEVAWDVDTIYLSQDSRELCLHDFDHLKERDLVPIVSALVHNTWFTGLNANSIKLSVEVCNEILHVIKKNSVIESLFLSNTGISTEFVKRLSTTAMVDTQLQRLDLSNNLNIDDFGAEYLIGALSSRGKQCTYLDLTGTKVTSKGLNKVAEAMNRSPHVFSALQTLKLSTVAAGKSDDLQSMYAFLASPTMLNHLDLSGTEVEIDKLMTPLQRGCSQNLTTLKLSRVAYSRRTKDVVVQSSFKQFFATVVTLKLVDLSYVRIPPEALKDLFLGITSNRNLKDVHVDITGCEVTAVGVQTLTNCLPSTQNIARLDLTGLVKGQNSALNERELVQIFDSLGQNSTIRYLSLGQMYSAVKPKNMKVVMEKLVDILQAENSVVESLSLADSKLKDSMNMIINALGSNMSLTEIDISGNQMGDLGARMLSKALQINNKLRTIVWDKNNTTCLGFEDVALALEKSYTLHKMPVPVYDASVALRSEPQRTEQALQTIERLLQRNHSPQKYSSDQAYRLQQGFLISSTQQTVDRLVVQTQDTINALSLTDSLQPYTNAVQAAKVNIADADNSKTLLPQLYDIAIQSQKTGNDVSQKLNTVAEELKTVLENQMKKTVREMLEITVNQCSGIMTDPEFKRDIQTGCAEKSLLPKDFTSNVLDGVYTEIFNKLSELNLAVASLISDTVVDGVIDNLQHSHRTLTNHLNEKKKKAAPASEGTESPQIRQKLLRSQSERDSPKLMQRKSYARKIRPQSVIDKAVVQQALDAEKKSSLDPISQGSHSPRSGSRSPSTDGSCDREHVRSHDRVDQSKSSSKSRSSKSDSPTPQKPVKVPRSRPKKSKSKTSSQVALDSSASKASIPKIEVTSADGNDLDPDPLYDNAPDVRGSPRCHRSNIDDLNEEPDLHIPKHTKVRTPTKAVPDKEVELDVVPELPEYGKLTHVTKDRARVKRNVRPPTRQSAATSTSGDRVDEGVDNFFSKASSTPTTPVSNGPDSGNKTPSSGGFSLFGKKTPPKPSPTSKRVSDVKETEEDEEDFVPSKERKPSSGDTSSQNSNQNNGSESGSIKGSLERKFDKSAQKLSGSSLERGSSPRVSSERGQKSSGIALERSQSPRVSFGKGQKGPNNSEETPEEAKNDEKKTKSDSEDSDAEHENGESQKVVGLKKSDSTSSSGSEKVAKKPLKVPMKLKSVEKPVEKEVESDIDETEEAKTEEKEEKEAATTVKDDKEKVDDKTEEEKKEEPSPKPPKAEEGKPEEKEVKPEEKEGKPEEKEGKPEEKEEKPKEEEAPKPEPVKPRKPGGPGAIGFGGNILAQLKEKQEKRISMAPKQPVVTDKSKNPVVEEKPLPFGLPKLRPVSGAKDSDGGPTKKETKSTDSVKSSGSKSETEEQKPAVKDSGIADGEKPSEKLKKNFFKESKDKPSVVPRPGFSGRPPPPMKPKPPGGKPTPAPRRSTADDQDEPVKEPKKMEQNSKKPEAKKVESGVVYDSATLKKSVREKMSMFSSSGDGDENEAKNNSLLTGSYKEEHSRKGISSPSLSGKSGSLPRDTKPFDVTKSQMHDKSSHNDATPGSEAGDTAFKREHNSNDMTDSGIVYDSETLARPSVKDAAAVFGQADKSEKSSSLSRKAKPSDMKESPEVTRRPKSMFEVLQNRPDLKKSGTLDTPLEKEENKETVEEKGSPTEDVILV
ncbi:F-actin-uncapping protein LRRC16A-like isoform X3 [Mya arenaria]|uniref:F-actin-uncapping protein LRRC16A-like isoform X3 n=1 Tax=Mya arenaria TaxID=6604 RepID=UPI0022E86035|nr:F-actin-uncapping protein LRRC16A-like isoform X3 [Mya arenaria]